MARELWVVEGRDDSGDYQFLEASPDHDEAEHAAVRYRFSDWLRDIPAGPRYRIVRYVPEEDPKP